MDIKKELTLKDFEDTIEKLEKLENVKRVLKIEISPIGKEMLEKSVISNNDKLILKQWNTLFGMPVIVNENLFSDIIKFYYSDGTVEEKGIFKYKIDKFIFR